METVFGLMALGVTAWVVIILALIGILIGVESEKYGLSTFFVIAAGLLLIYLTSSFSAVWHAVTANPHIIINVLLVYAAAGVVWGVIKWFFFLMRVRDLLVAFRKNYGIEGSLTERQRYDFFDKARRQVSMGYGRDLPPKPSDNKGRIIFWMIWWPFSMPWTLINDPVKRFFNFIYDRIAGFLQGMSNRLFKGLS